MNTYKAIFHFKNRWHTFAFDANQLANAALEPDDDINNFIFDNDGQDFEYRLRINDDFYTVTFSLGNPNYVNVYHAGEEGTLVEENIPWLLLTVVNQNKDVMYNITEGL